MKFRISRGFTLVETIVVVTIFSIIALGLSMSFISGMKIWSRAKNINQSQTSFFIASEKFSSELRQAVNVTAIGFEGNNNEISFPRVIDNSVVKVIYRFDLQKKTFLRSQIPLKDILEEKIDEQYNEKDILAAGDLEISYLCFNASVQAYTWQPAWEKIKDIFMAVKIKAIIQNEEFTKTIFVPT